MLKDLMSLKIYKKLELKVTYPKMRIMMQLEHAKQK